MKKQTILILFLVLCAISVSAAPVGKSKAQAIAASFFQKRSMKAKVKGATVMLSKEYASSKDAPTAFYAFSRGENVVFVSADDEMPAILGYSDRTDLDNLPPAMEYMLDYYARLTDAVRRGEIPAPKLYASPAAVEPLCKTIWDQKEPFCSLCPVYEGKKTPNGCVSTGVAQVMKYHEWPTKPTGTIEAYKTMGENPLNPSQKTPVLEIPGVDLSTHTYNWADMINDYTGSYTEQQGQAVAQLCYDIAVASGMNFAPEGSGTPLYLAAKALRNNFGYNNDMYLDYPEYFTEEEWVEKLKNEISQKRPLPFSGTDAKTKEGHCFVIDGYNAEGFFHVNWGWSGKGNDYFLITSLKPNVQGIGGGADGINFSSEQYTIFNCIPDDGTSVASEHFRFNYGFCTGALKGDPEDIVISTFQNLSLDEFNGDVVMQLVDKDGKVVAEKTVMDDLVLRGLGKDGITVWKGTFDFSKFADGVYYPELIAVSKATGTKYPVRNVEEKSRIVVKNGQFKGAFRHNQEILLGEILSCEFIDFTNGFLNLKVKAQVSNPGDVDFVYDNLQGERKYLNLNAELSLLDDPVIDGGNDTYNIYENVNAGETKSYEIPLNVICIFEETLDQQVLTLKFRILSGTVFDEKKYPLKDLMATAINGVKADKELNAPTYNTMGQQVNPNATQGIFIRNGKKIVKK